MAISGFSIAVVIIFDKLVDISGKSELNRSLVIRLQRQGGGWYPEKNVFFVLLLLLLLPGCSFEGKVEKVV